MGSLSPTSMYVTSPPFVPLIFTLKCSLFSLSGSSIGDHAPVFLLLSGGPRAQWRSPNCLIKNPDFKRYFTEQLSYFITENNTLGVSPNLLWETAEAVNRGFTVSFSAESQTTK